MRTAEKIKIAGRIIALLAIAYFVVFAVHTIHDFPKIAWSTWSVVALLVTTLLYTSGIFIASLAWHLMLVENNVTIDIGRSTFIYATTQFAKYLPGNVGHQIGRFALAQRFGVAPPVIASTMVTEVCWVLIAGCLIVVNVMLWDRGVLVGNGHTSFSLSIIAVVSVLSFAAPFLLIKLVNEYRPQWLGNIIGHERVIFPSAITFVLCILLDGVLFILMGLGAWLVSWAVLYSDATPYWRLTGILAAGWLAGFITPGAPAGIGVREAILLTGLAPIVGSSEAVTLTVLLRILNVIGDALAFLFAIAAKRLLVRHDSDLL